MRRLAHRSPGSYGVMIGPVDDHKPPAKDKPVQTLNRAQGSSEQSAQLRRSQAPGRALTCAKWSARRGPAGPTFASSRCPSPRPTPKRARGSSPRGGRDGGGRRRPPRARSARPRTALSGAAREEEARASARSSISAAWREENRLALVQRATSLRPWSTPRARAGARTAVSQLAVARRVAVADDPARTDAVMLNGLEQVSGASTRCSSARARAAAACPPPPPSLSLSLSASSLSPPRRPRPPPLPARDSAPSRARSGSRAPCTAPSSRRATVGCLLSPRGPDLRARGVGPGRGRGRARGRRAHRHERRVASTTPWRWSPRRRASRSCCGEARARRARRHRRARRDPRPRPRRSAPCGRAPGRARRAAQARR